MGLFSTSKSPEQVIAEEEGEVTVEIWNLIKEEETDLEKLRQLEKQKPDRKTALRAVRALKNLRILIEEDLDMLERKEESLESEFGSNELQGKFREAAEENLEILNEVIKRLGKDNKNLEKWLKMVENAEKTDQEIEDLIQIEEKIENDLEEIGGLMEKWNDLQQFSS